MTASPIGLIKFSPPPHEKKMPDITRVLNAIDVGDPHGAAAKPPYPDFPFPGYVATDSLHWLRAEYEAATDDEAKLQLASKALRRSEASGDKHEAVRWQNELAKYVSEAATPQQQPTSP